MRTLNREDRKIKDYFKHISDSNLWDLACEIVIELGDMKFWQEKVEIKEDVDKHKFTRNKNDAR